MNKPTQGLTKTLNILAVLVLAGCGPLPEHMCAESEYAGASRAMEACAKDHTCVLTGKDAAYIQWHREHFPECFSQKVER